MTRPSTRDIKASELAGILALYAIGIAVASTLTAFTNELSALVAWVIARMGGV